jgi:ABC-2 type transport system permease protein
MTTAAPGVGGRLAVRPVSQGRVIKSEWIKLRSLRSTIWTLLAAFIIVVGLGLAISAGQAHERDHGRNFDPLLSSLGGTFLAQLAIGVLGVMMITGEYATGSSRSTFAAVPKRLPVLWAKAVVYAVVAFVVMTIAAFIAFFGGQGILSSKHLNVTLSDDGVLPRVFGSPFYLVLIGLMGLGLGAIIRSTAGGIAALVALVLILPIIFSLLPSSVNDNVGPYLPGNAGQALFQLKPDDNALSPGAGVAVLVAWVAVVIAIGAVLLKRRDV